MFRGRARNLIIIRRRARRCKFHSRSIRKIPLHALHYCMFVTAAWARPTDHRIDIDREVAVGGVATHHYVILALDFVHVAVAVHRPPTRRRGSCLPFCVQGLHSLPELLAIFPKMADSAGCGRLLLPAALYREISNSSREYI